MLFSIIYEANWPIDTHAPLTTVEEVAPPNRRRLWELTEARDEEAYWDGETRMRHRKWAAVLTREQFDEFIRKTWLTADHTETMGSIGAPGFGFGWAPAVSFSYDSDGQSLNAYVTPVPEVNGEARPDLLGKHQDRIFAAVRKVYGDEWERIVFGRPAQPVLQHTL